MERRPSFQQRSQRKKIVPDQTSIFRLDINWLNINQSSSIAKGSALKGVSNYYTEACPSGALFVKAYEDVTYQNIYKGIDLKWYQKNGHLKYDYIIAAGADYTQIQLELNGAETTVINKRGELVLKTPLGEIIEQAPIVFQNGKKLNSRWILKKNIASFFIEDLNPTQAFVIDPAIRTWGTYYGGNSTDIGFFCKTDALGNVYMVGSTNSSFAQTIATTGSYLSTFAGGSYDAYLVKFDPNGARIWATYYGGSGYETAVSCSIDGANNVYITGTTSDLNGIAAFTGHQLSFGGGNYDAFLVKFDANGARLWGTYYGGSGDEFANLCCTDLAGNTYLVGTTGTSTGTVIATPGVHQSNYGGGVADVFIVKFNTNGSRLWGTYYGGSGYDEGLSCVLDGSGNIFMSGSTDSNVGTAIASVGSHQAIYGGGTRDAFLVKFNSNGVRQWGTYYGGTDSDMGYSCVADQLGNVYMCGTSWSSNGNAIATAGSHQTTIGGGIDGFLVKFSATGVRQWGTYYGGSGNDYVYSCFIDAVNNVFFCGSSSSNSGNAISTPNNHQSIYGGGNFDAFLVKLNSNGLRQWGTYYGGLLSDQSMSCTSDLAGNLYLSGTTSSTLTLNNTISTGSYQFNYGGGSSDAFLAKFFDCQNPLAPTNTTPANNMSICSNTNAILTVSVSSGTVTWYTSATSTNVINTGTVYTTPILSVGNYTYYTESYTCAQSLTRTPIILTVNSLPTLSVNNASVCMGNSYTINPSGAATYTFLNGNAVVTPSSTTSYSIVGTSSLGCISSNTAVCNVTLISNPTIAANSGTVCSGTAFTINPSGATTYTFLNGNSVVTPSSNASYSIVGTSSLGCISSNTAVCNITVFSNPTITANSGTICSGTAFTINPNGASNYTISGGSNVVLPANTSTYSISGVSAQGCIGNTVVSVLVLPSVTLSVSGSSAICQGQSVNLTANGAASYTWNTGATSNAITQTPSVNTTYSVIGASSTCSNTAIFAVAVNPIPTITAVSNTSLLCIGQSATLNANGASTYTWSPGGTGSSIIVSPSVTTTYNITGQGLNGCLNSTSFTQLVSVCTAVVGSINSQTNNLKIYPNPTNDLLNLDLDNPNNDQIVYSVKDILGQALFTNFTQLNKVELNVSELPSGIYFITLQAGDTTTSLKFIKQ